MKTKKLLFCSVISLCLLSLVGCAGKPTTADKMRGHASDLQVQVDLRKELAKDHEKGKKLVSTGKQRVKNGEKLVERAARDQEKGQDYIDKGNSEIAEGNKLIQESERRFRENFPELDINPVE